MSFYCDTLSWTNQSLLSCLNSVYVAEKHHIPILYLNDKLVQVKHTRVDLYFCENKPKVTSWPNLKGQWKNFQVEMVREIFLPVKWAMDILRAKTLIYTVDIWATKFQLTLKSMWTIERSSQPLPVLTCKVLHGFNVWVKQLLLFSQDGHNGNGNTYQNKEHGHSISTGFNLSFLVF
jgi:hypothetical protein